MGWPPEVVYTTDINILRIAQEGRMDMLQAIFGKGDDKTFKSLNVNGKASAADLKALAQDVNAKMQAKRRRPRQPKDN